MDTIYLLNHNNYYNRIAKKPITLNETIANALLVRTPFNFIPGDGVNTEAIINYAEDLVVNYLVCIHNNVLSRWFIIESIRTTAGQYRLQLHRDLIADAYDDVMNAPMFIEKAKLSQDDPMIFNSEQMSFNQIKVKETLLKDSTNKAWIVGYCDSKSQLQLDNVSPSIQYDEDLSTMTSSQWISDHPSIKVFAPDKTKLQINLGYHPDQGEIYSELTLNSIDHGTLECSTLKTSLFGTDLYVLKLNGGDPSSTAFNYWYLNYPFNLSSNEQAIINSFIKTTHNLTTNNTYPSLNGRVIKFSDGYFRINYTEYQSTESQWIDTVTGSTPVTTIKNNIQSWTSDFFAGHPFYISDTAINTNGHPLKYKYSSVMAIVSLTQLSVSTGNISFNALATSRDHLVDNPYDIFFMEDTAYNRLIANYLMIYNDTRVYDCQLLPYCPDIYGYNNPTSSSRFPVTEGTGSGTSTTSYVYFAKKSSGTVSIPLSIPITNKKIMAETKTWRLCSPNYNGLFEFNVAKNNGLTGFEVDFTYLPYNPYIHVHPIFEGLYGQDYEDARGLICGGDFSLPRIRDAWESYQLQNKNYQAIFDRSIQSMEIHQNAERLQQGLNIIGGGAIGTTAGGKIGGVIGAIAGGALSVAGGIADFAVSESLRNEAIDYRKDQYGYQLGNIQALPQSVSKTTAYTANNKVWVFLEEYDCTDVERQALENKIKYNGMTVMRIGTISEFITSEETYIKGKLIRMDSSNYDNHFTNQLANELYMGIFIKEE